MVENVLRDKVARGLFWIDDLIDLRLSGETQQHRKFFHAQISFRLQKFCHFMHRSIDSGIKTYI